MGVDRAHTGDGGRGGHASRTVARRRVCGLHDRVGGTRVIGIDRDPDALAQSREALRAYGDRVSLVHSDYRNLVGVLDACGIDVVDAVSYTHLRAHETPEHLVCRL